MNLDKARENLIKLIETTETIDASVLYEYYLLFRNVRLLYNKNATILHDITTFANDFSTFVNNFLGAEQEE